MTLRSLFSSRKTCLFFLLFAALILSACYFFRNQTGLPVVWAYQSIPGKAGQPWLYEQTFSFTRFLNDTLGWDTDLFIQMGSVFAPTYPRVRIVTLDLQGRECFTPVACESSFHLYWMEGMIIHGKIGDGYLSKTGKWILPPIYKSINPVNDRWFKADFHGEPGWVNIENHWQREAPKLEPKPDTSNYQAIDNAFYQVNIIPSESGDILTDLSGKILFQEKGIQIRGFRSFNNYRIGEKLIAVRSGQNWGLIQSDGRWFIPPKFAYLGPYREGLIPAGIGRDEQARKMYTRIGYIDSTGTWAIPPIFSKAHRFSEGLAAAQDPKTELWGFINHQGEWQIHPQFKSGLLIDMDHAFKQGFCKIHLAEGWGLLDRQGKWVVPPEFETLGWLPYLDDTYQTAIFQKNKKWGMIHKTGKILVEGKYILLEPIANPLLPDPIIEGDW